VSCLKCLCQYNGISYPINTPNILHLDGCQKGKCVQIFNGQAEIQWNGDRCCTYKGKIMKIGEIYDKGDGCTKCECLRNLQVNCQSNCCYENGNAYTIGQIFRGPDDCECRCNEDKQVSCLKCLCQYNGISYPINTPNILHSDGCQSGTCIRNMNGVAEIQWNGRVCPKECIYNGRTYPPNTDVQHLDGCQRGPCLVNANGQAEIRWNGERCCNYKGKMMKIGEVLDKGDGCTLCRCNADLKVTCEFNCCNYDGKTYTYGQTFMKPDGCTSCRCNEDGQVRCDNRCPQFQGCICNGRQIIIGQSCERDCNKCDCMLEGSPPKPNLRCTQRTCGCRENGRVYKVGETWDRDSCTGCVCRQTGTTFAPSCTKKPGCKV